MGLPGRRKPKVEKKEEAERGTRNRRQKEEIERGIRKKRQEEGQN